MWNEKLLSSLKYCFFEITIISFNDVQEQQGSYKDNKVS